MLYMYRSDLHGMLTHYQECCHTVELGIEFRDF